MQVPAELRIETQKLVDTEPGQQEGNCQACRIKSREHQPAAPAAARRSKTKDSAYECGMLPIGGPQPRFSVKFYLVAMLQKTVLPCAIISLKTTAQGYMNTISRSKRMKSIATR